MKILRIPLVIVLLVACDRGFNAGAQTETNLHSFVGSPDGADPYAPLVQASDGYFYSTTYYGGTYNSGTVFRLSLSGSITNLYSFGSQPNDGSVIWAGLVQGSDSNFYGTAQDGGAHGYGSVFRISPSGSETNLYSFTGAPHDGANSFAALIQGSDGNLYGTTTAGGTSNAGTVFRISPSGSETNLHSFAGGPHDGAGPFAALVQGSDGNFYATAYSGGTHNSGTVFRISPGGSYTNLYSFGSHPDDGAYPAAPLVQGSDGNFYSTTYLGGANNNGIVFRISPNGSETNLHSFGTAPNDGDPYSGLVLGSDGNFYGVSIGTAFRITPAGTLTTLFSITTSNGVPPYPNTLVQGSDGNFYGTTYYGGTSANCSGSGCGIVFRFSVPLNPPPNQISAAQITGNDVAFSIPSVAYETYQLQFTTDPTSGTWSNVPGASVTNSIGALMTLTNFGGASQPQGFYRFEITP